jgi:hypothetical protein
MSECRFEERVRQAAAGGAWTDELRDHCASCAPCAETTLVTAALCDDARFLAAEAEPLPDPRALWLRARIDNRVRCSRRAVSGIVWVHRLALCTAVLVGLVITPRVWSVLARSAEAVTSVSFLPSLPVAVAAPAIVLVMSFAALALMAVWNEVAEES